MLWIAISKNGMSKPYLQKSGPAIDQNVYKRECLQKQLIPYLKENHFDDNYIFWPDKASAHYVNIKIRQTFISVGQSKTFSVICVASFIGMVGVPKILIIS